MNEKITVCKTSEVTAEEWGELQRLQREAFKATLDQSDEQIDELVHWCDPAYYAISHANPNARVDQGSFFPNQQFYRPRIAVAVDDLHPVGFALGADNVSGQNETVRRIKDASIKKRYFWLGEIAVAPAYQGFDMARDITATLLRSGRPLQPVTAYIWPSLNKPLQYELESLGFEATGAYDTQIFGLGSEPVEEVRMEAPSIRGVLQNLY